MANPAAINTLVELASREVDAASEQLGSALAAGEEAEQKLNMLLQYRSDYASRCQANLETGLSAAAYSNFCSFMQKLDHAINGQQEIVRESKQRIEQAYAAWVSSEQKKMSFGTLANRVQNEALRKESRRDQKLSDEHAARQALRKHKRGGTQ